MTLKPAHYWVLIRESSRKWHIAYWTGSHFEMHRHPDRFYHEDFHKIGPCVEDQLIAGSACAAIRNFVKEANI